ncbi:MAG: hypothetical protein WAM82_18450 [Thermoanaerobaculia bacterium]
MKKITDEPGKGTDDLLSEYDFDYSKAKPNRFAASQKRRLAVVLDSDVAEVFKTPESVNKALRALLEAVPGLEAGAGRSKR